MKDASESPRKSLSYVFFIFLYSSLVKTAKEFLLFVFTLDKLKMFHSKHVPVFFFYKIYIFLLSASDIPYKIDSTTESCSGTLA